MLTDSSSATRLMKASLLVLAAVFALLVGLNNILDYQSNFMFVQHVLSMDTTFEGNKLMWRGITTPWIHQVAYWLIILTELVTAMLCGAGAWRLFAARHASAEDFVKAKVLGAWGLMLGICLWFGGFLTIGGEWFLMWQSASWNGQEAAFRIVIYLLACLLFLMQAEAE